MIFMLSKRFYEIWLLGTLDDKVMEKIKECLSDAIRCREERARIRIYTEDQNDVSYLDYLRKVLIDNTLLSIVLEFRDIKKIFEDLESKDGEVTLIINKSPLHIDLMRFRDRLKVIEVEG